MGPKLTNSAAIDQWNRTATTGAMEATADDGDFAKRHLVNAHLLEMLGDVAGARVLDAGSGNGYLSRMLAGRGAHVVGIEPTDRMITFAQDKEVERGGSVEYIQADLARAPDLGAPFDAVVCSMVLMAVPDWRPAMNACIEALRPGGVAVFAIVHPAFEGLSDSWRRHGYYRADRYLEEYEIVSPVASDFHRPLSAYLNELSNLGCRLIRVVEPGLDPATAASVRADDPAAEALVLMPNFLVFSGRKE